MLEKKYLVKEAKIKDYETLVSFFIENELEFSEEEPVPTDLVKCWRADDPNTGELKAAAVLAKREGKFILDGIAVESSLRGGKIGETLLEEVINETKSRHGNEIYLVARAPEFFRKNGFVDIAREEAPNFFECLTCPQYGETCFPEVMKKELQ
ncbi:MAG: GNAT family N-acetyltransferase [Anaerovoracaceae bacterium]